MSDYKRVLTVQDISCFGQCSLTVALPIISVCGVETCVLPSAVLSTHTGGFSGYTFRDLTDDMPAIKDHWVKEGIKFDAIYTGYLGSVKQISYVKDILSQTGNEGCMTIVDPVMADNGKLYVGFDMAFVDEMKSLCAVADIILPNITEACFLTGAEYKTNYDESYISSLVERLKALGAKTVIMTGVSYKEGSTGVVISDCESTKYYEHALINGSFHGTGDVYASAFVGGLMNDLSPYDAAKLAANYTVLCIKETIDDNSHKYGVKFEKAIPYLVQSLAK